MRVANSQRSLNYCDIRIHLVVTRMKKNPMCSVTEWIIFLSCGDCQWIELWGGGGVVGGNKGGVRCNIRLSAEHLVK